MNNNIRKRISLNKGFIEWVSFLVSMEESMKEALKFDEFETRDFFARQGVERLPSEVKEIMVAVSGVMDAFDYYKKLQKGCINDDDTGLDSE